MNYLASSLRERHPPSTLHILQAKRNTGSFTYDGIELGGERVAQEIEDTLQSLSKSNNDQQPIRKISIVGYSLGGLIGRYAIGLLYAKGWFDDGKLEPVNFTTFATPHLGTRTPLLGWNNKLFNVLGARTLSTSGHQLFMIDTFRDTGKPLLAVLASPESIFIKALARFKRRTLYANITNDRTTPFYTSYISKTDPYTSLEDSSVALRYEDDYEPVVLHGKDPVSIPPGPDELPSFYRRHIVPREKYLRNLPKYIFLIAFIPFGSIFFLITAGVQTVRSRQRIRMHDEGRAGVGVGAYRTPGILAGVRGAVEGMVEGMAPPGGQQYLPEGAEEQINGDIADPMEAEPSQDAASAVHTHANGKAFTAAKQAEKPSPSSSSSSSSSSASPSDEERPDLHKTRSGSSSPFPTLALTPAQFAMINSLDNVGWNKSPIYIHKVMHSHAAIIVRIQWRKGLWEGKTVVKHWLDKEFEV